MTLEIEVMLPLYPPTGAPVRGYVCCSCRDVTKTKRGMWTHLRIVHGIKKQAQFAFEAQPEKRAYVESTV